MGVLRPKQCPLEPPKLDGGVGTRTFEIASRHLNWSATLLALEEQLV